MLFAIPFAIVRAPRRIMPRAHICLVCLDTHGLSSHAVKYNVSVLLQHVRICSEYSNDGMSRKKVLRQGVEIVFEFVRQLETHMLAVPPTPTPPLFVQESVSLSLARPSFFVARLAMHAPTQRLTFNPFNPFNPPPTTIGWLTCLSHAAFVSFCAWSVLG